MAVEEIVIGAGARGDPYHRVGQIICKLLNHRADDINCSVLKTPAGDANPSFANLVNVRDGAVELGVARSDWQYFAVTGTGPVRYLHTKFDTIRSLFTIDVRLFTLMAGRKTGIRRLDDLKGRRVNVGKPRTDHRKSINVLMAIKKWTKRDFAIAEEFTIAEQSFALCNGMVEAISYVVSHPNPVVERAIRLCDAQLIEIGGSDINELLIKHPYLVTSTISGDMYVGSPNPVGTFGTAITLVSSSEVSDELIYNIVKTIFGNLHQFRQKFPALQHLSPAQMVKAGNTAALHAGAQRFYQEQGF